MLDRFGSASALLLAALSVGCGSRAVDRPTTPDGYQQLDLRDVRALAPRAVNVELVGVLGPITPHEVCGGLVSFSFGGVMVTLPRSRYDEVRDLKPIDRVRVRGYLSEYMAEGCSIAADDASRFLWADSIDRVAPTPR